MIFAVGLALLVAWPVYNIVLVACSVLDSGRGRRRRPMRGRDQEPGPEYGYGPEHGYGPAPERGQRREPVGPSPSRPETFWIIVPALNEERVVARTVKAALRLAGPNGVRPQVLVVDDGSDDATPEVLAAIYHRNLHVLRRNLPDARRGKGEALNAAYRYIRDHTAAGGGDPARVAIGVIDGDGRGRANLLHEVAGAFDDPRVGAVQCRVRIHNRDRLLGAIQDLEFACIANASQLMRNGLGTVGLGGNGQFVRLSTLDKLGDAPWSACLVEDLELGLRIHLAGDVVRYVSRAWVSQQGLVDVGRLLRQRTRWAQGNLQCARYVPRLIASRRISNPALLEMLYYLLAPWANAGGTVAVAGLGAYVVWRLLPGNGPAFVVTSWSQLAVAVAVWLAALVTPGLMWVGLHRWHLRDERLSRCLLAALAYPGFLLLGLVSTWRALGRQIGRRNTWAKTERLVEA